MSESLMKLPSDLFIPNKQVRRKVGKNQIVQIALLGMTLTRAKSGILMKWKRIMYQLGVRAVLRMSEIAKCCVRGTIEQKEIDKSKNIKSINL